MRICIDAGHGGADSGAVGPTGLQEKEVVLLLAHLLKCNLERKYDVIMTRYGDENAGLSSRARMANNSASQLFVSLHFNAAEGVVQRPGAEVWHFPNSPLGVSCAELVLERIVQGMRLASRGIKASSEFVVLQETKCPAILVEPAFISDLKQESLMRQTSWLVQLAVCIAKGICQWEEEYCKKDKRREVKNVD